MDVLLVGERSRRLVVDVGIEVTTRGLDAVDKFPALLEELARRGWSDEDLARLAGRNLLRVMRAAEAVGAKLRMTEGPSSATLGELDGATKP